MMEMDWDALSLPEVDNIAKQVANRIARDYDHVIERDDAYQECLIILAGRGARVRRQVEAGDLGYVQRELDRDMVNMLVTQAKHRAKHLSYEVLVDGAE